MTGCSFLRKYIFGTEVEVNGEGGSLDAVVEEFYGSVCYRKFCDIGNNKSATMTGCIFPFIESAGENKFRLIIIINF